VATDLKTIPVFPEKNSSFPDILVVLFGLLREEQNKENTLNVISGF